MRRTDTAPTTLTSKRSLPVLHVDIDQVAGQHDPGVADNYVWVIWPVRRTPNGGLDLLSFCNIHCNSQRNVAGLLDFFRHPPRRCWIDVCDSDGATMQRQHPGRRFADTAAAAGYQRPIAREQVIAKSK